MFYFYFSVDFRCILGGGTPSGTTFDVKVAGGRPRWLGDDFSTIFRGIWVSFGVPGWALGVLWRMFFETDPFESHF